jgi:pimeloyl-ACP methyl ester carboxylesterase
MTPTPTCPTHHTLRVQGPEGEMAIHTWGQPQHPTVVLVHGYPDNALKWEGVAQLLSQSFYVVAYDVRGAGQSFQPTGGTQAYRLQRLCADFKAVIDALSPNRPVHLVAHDWGSIQSWEFATEPSLKGRVASYTSMSGPCLDHVGHWFRDRLMRPTPRHVGQALKQLSKSWYIYLFHLPFLPELLWKAFLGPRWHDVMRWLEKLDTPPRPTQTRDGLNGVSLYRANFIPALWAPRERMAIAPVQVLVPTGDHYVSPALSEDLRRWVPHLWRRPITGGHWLTLQTPEPFAQMVREFIEHIEGAPESAALSRARVQGVQRTHAHGANAPAGGLSEHGTTEIGPAASTVSSQT